MKTILVTGAGGGGSNNLIRGFRRIGYPVRIIGTNADQYKLIQSLADRNYLIPNGDAGRSYQTALCKVIEAEKVDLVIPNNDTEVRAVATIRDELPARTFLPSHATIELCQDKYSLSTNLSANGFKVARTYAIPGIDAVDEIYANFTGAEKLWCRMRRGSGSRGSLPVKSPEHVKFWIRYWNEMHGIPENMFTLSEYLPGRDFAFQSIWKDGQLVIAKTCQRLSYFFGYQMPSGTSSTPQIGRLVNNPEVNRICTQAVQAIDPHATGMFSIDLKEDSNGVPCITEINIGRFFMITIAFNSVGVYNMAELYLKLAFGEDFQVDEKARYGDIGDEETFLIRELDNDPEVLSATEMRQRYISLLE